MNARVHAWSSKGVFDVVSNVTLNRILLDEMDAYVHVLCGGCRFHYAKAGAEVHKCGPSNSADSFDSLRWVNTSAIESVNSFLKGFRSLGWYSGLENLMVILPLLVDAYAGLKRVDDGRLCIAIVASCWSVGVRHKLLLG
jgi:hypothetical protein